MKKTTLFVYALAGGLLWGSLSARAQQRIQMTTSRAAGSQLSFVLNKHAAVEVDWGNGTPVSCTADELGRITGTLAGATVTVSGSFSTLDCSGIGLTKLVLNEAPGLAALNCSGNELSQLSLTSNKAMSQLDCGSNKLTTLTVPRASEMLYLDCSQNQLSSLSLTNMSRLETLICSDNKLGALTPKNAPNLKTLWCDNNNLRVLAVSDNRLESLACSGNNITSFTTKVSANTAMVDCWISGNKFKALNLTGATTLQTLDCSDMGLTDLQLSEPEGKLLCCYLNGNSLNLTQMLATALVNGDYRTDNQSPFALYNTTGTEVSKIQVGDGVRFDPMPHPIGNEKTTTIYSWYTTADDTKLVNGSTKDYTRASATNTFTFKKPFSSIYCAVTNSAVSGLTLKSKPLWVYEEGMSVADVLKEKGFRYSLESDAILMNADEEVKVNIYSVDGKSVWSGTVGQWGVRVPLKGRTVYFVNGIKVIL